MHAVAAVLALALAAELPPTVAPEAPAPAPAAPVEAPASPAPVAAPAPPRVTEPAEPEPARALAPEVLESIGDAAVKYSWSGPLKWGAIASASGGLGVIATADERATNTKKLGGALIGVGLVQAGIALAIDASARASLAEAGPVRARRAAAPDEEEDDDEDGSKPKARAAPKPTDDYEDDYEL